MIAFAIGAAFALAVAFAAYRAHALDRGGAIAAFAVGTLTFGIGGWQATLVLFAFFVPSTLLSRLGRVRKRALTDIGKGGARDAWQVFANGGVAALALLFARVHDAAAFAAFAGAFAAASADTWGTEIGTLARGTPRSILTLRRLATGLSGGITLRGSLATLGGAACVALVAGAVHLASSLPIFIAGVVGAFADSFLGASAQALRYCPACARDCETDPHVCGTPTVLRRGMSWLGNDAVNLAATLAGAAIGVLLA
ncbi:MAG: DUF92 domain-containing protein [bacterium]|nr:DUF92 domain-containing protein [bacterium]